MSVAKPSAAYVIVSNLVRFFTTRPKFLGTENLPDEPCILVGNHSQMIGPIVSELYFPGEPWTWCAGEMIEKSEVADYAFQDFWSEKPKWNRWFFRIISRIIPPLSASVFGSARVVAVYHDMRVISTYRDSVSHMLEGGSLFIFPEHDVPYNNIVCEFQDRFVDTARFYYKKSGQAVPFVPVYVCPKLKTVSIGKPIRFDPAAPAAKERVRISHGLMNAITDLAAALPAHTVVPYNNVKKKDYPRSLPVTPATEQTQISEEAE